MEKGAKSKASRTPVQTIPLGSLFRTFFAPNLRDFSLPRPVCLRSPRHDARPHPWKHLFSDSLPLCDRPCVPACLCTYLFRPFVVAFASSLEDARRTDAANPSSTKEDPSSTVVDRSMRRARRPSRRTVNDDLRRTVLPTRLRLSRFDRFRGNESCKHTSLTVSRSGPCPPLVQCAFFFANHVPHASRTNCLTNKNPF